MDGWMHLFVLSVASQHLFISSLTQATESSSNVAALTSYTDLLLQLPM